MAMGREHLPPEEADSWGEFHARLELEQAASDGPLMPLWQVAGGSGGPVSPRVPASDTVH